LFSFEMVASQTGNRGAWNEPVSGEVGQAVDHEAAWLLSLPRKPGGANVDWARTCFWGAQA